MLLEEIPIVEGITTVHFPDIDISYFRSLLDFLYSGQTCVPANEVEHLHDLLDLLQIKPGIWRTGTKDGKNAPGETVEVLSRLFSENHKRETGIDINSNEGDGLVRSRSKSRDSSPCSSVLKRERPNDSSGDEERDNEVDNDIEEEEEDLVYKKSYIRNSHFDQDDMQNEDDGTNDCDVDNQIRENSSERRRSSSDPVNLSLGLRDRDDDSNDGHIDVETIGSAPSKVIKANFKIIDIFQKLFETKFNIFYRVSFQLAC